MSKQVRIVGAVKAIQLSTME